MKYYFFNDLKSETNGITDYGFCAVGVIDKVYNSKENAKGNKDLSVLYLNPYTFKKCSEWRTYNEIKLYEVTKEEHEALELRINSFDY